MKKAHPGFAAVQSKVASRKNPRTGKPYGKKVAGAIIASAARKASPMAKKMNPNLKKVKGK
jgi:hypothetical protein